MSNNGYVYVLLNPSIQGMVKIGMTTRDPENRVHELSSATGVATPFVLVYKEFFDDCLAAEKKIHAYLEQQNYRVSSNREFFNVPVHEAINIIQLYRSEQQHDSNPNEYEHENSITRLAKDTYLKATDYYYGNDGYLQDYYEALKLFKQAVRLGEPAAYEYIGQIFEKGEGVNTNIRTALENYKLGAESGVIDCFARMAQIYTIVDDFRHKENAIKCWDAYYKNIGDNINILRMVTHVVTFTINNWYEINDILLRKYKNPCISALRKSISEHSNDYFFVETYTRSINYLET